MTPGWSAHSGARKFAIVLILYLYCPIALTYDNEIDFPWLVHRDKTMCIVFITCRLYTVG